MSQIKSMSSNIPFTTQSNADVSSEERGEQTKYVGE